MIFDAALSFGHPFGFVSLFSLFFISFVMRRSSMPDDIRQTRDLAGARSLQFEIPNAVREHETSE